jgi:hypothetical protein
MTQASLMHFAQALLWCTLLFVSIAGYGAILLRLFGLRRPSVTLAAISGVAVVIFLGGCLNLVRAITSPILLALILIGLIAAILSRITITGSGAQAETIPLHRPSSRAVVPLLFVVALIFAVRLGATVYAGQYQASDDYNYYLAAPVKMLQLHHYAADPFSERRILSSIGGNYFLQTMVLVALPLESLQMADRTLGLILLAFLSFGLAATLRLTPAQRAVFAFLVLFTPQIQFNLTFVLLPSALFFGLVYLAANRKVLADNGILVALLLGAVAGAVSAMKSTYLAHSVVFLLSIAFFQWRRTGFAEGAKTLAFATLGILIVMAPWMIANHSASGTFLYPMLGLGYHYAAYGLYPPPSGAGSHIVLHKVIPFCIPLVFLLILEWSLVDRDEQGDAILALSVAAFTGVLLVGIVTGGDSVRRYNYACVLPAIILLYVVFCRRANASPETRRWRLLQTCSVALTVLVALSIWTNTLSNEFMQIPRSYQFAYYGTPIVAQDIKAEYAAMESAIPTDGSVLATVANSFLLDFRSHDIKVADYPSAASLPPGWPSRQDGDTLARYLLANNLRYLVYDYASFVGFDEIAPSAVADPSRRQWVRSEIDMSYRSHQQFAELAHTRRHLYDDGKMYVLDLATPADTPAAALAPPNSPETTAINP